MASRLGLGQGKNVTPQKFPHFSCSPDASLSGADHDPAFSLRKCEYILSHLCPLFLNPASLPPHSFPSPRVSHLLCQLLQAPPDIILSS